MFEKLKNKFTTLLEKTNKALSRKNRNIEHLICCAWKVILKPSLYTSEAGGHLHLNRKKDSEMLRIRLP